MTEGSAMPSGGMAHILSTPYDTNKMKIIHNTIPIEIHEKKKVQPRFSPEAIEAI